MRGEGSDVTCEKKLREGTGTKEAMTFLLIRGGGHAGGGGDRGKLSAGENGRPDRLEESGTRRDEGEK